MNQPGAQDTIDLKAVFRKILGKWWLFLITISIALAGGVAYLKTTPKQYRVQAVLRMSEGKRASFGAQREEFLKGSGFLKAESELEDEITMIKSTSNITKTLRRLNFGITYYQRARFLTQELYGVAEPFRVKLDSVALQITGVPIYVDVDTAAKTYRVRAEGKNVLLYNVQQEKLMDDFVPKLNIDQTVAMGQPFSGDHLSFQIEFPSDRVYKKGTSYFFYINSLEALILQWRGVSVDPMSEESNIVILGVSGEVVTKQVKFLDKLMETYLADELYKQQKKGLSTINFIEEKIDTVSRTLGTAQQDIQSIRQRGGAFNVGDMASNIMEQRSRLQDERAQWSRKREYCQQILTKLQNSEGAGQNVPPPSASGIDDPQLNSLVTELVRVATDLSAQSLTTVKTNPVIIQLERRKRQLQASVASSAESLINQADISIADLNGRLAGLGGQVGSLAYNEAALSTKERDFKLSESLYNYLMEKKYEAGIAIASDEVDKSIVDAARQESLGPIAPDKKVVLGGAFFLGLMIPLLFILVRDFFNDKIADVEELKRLSGIPLLATIPTSKRKRITPEEPKSLLAESFRTARINLQYLNMDTATQVVGMTSSTSGEGKTFCSINLATVMALTGKRTLLIDADMRRPRIHEYLELPDSPGLSNLLIGEATVDEAIRKSGIHNLDVITAGPIPPNPLELVETPRMAQLFETLRQRYDHIVVDASPMGLVSEFKIIMGFVDVTLYVVRQGHTRRGMLRMVNELHREQKIKHVDLLLNDVRAGEGYGAGYGYYTK